MPVVTDRGLWGRYAPGVAAGRAIRIGLVNNMPDSALEATERQFRSILSAADRQVEIIHYALPGVPRGEAGEHHLLDRRYRDTTELRNADLDGLIVTGTEPKLSDLRREPYWASLADLFDWIAREGPPAIFSCLASHAAVLHYDGIERQRLPQKRFGVFEHGVVCPHELTQTVAPVLRIAHSRWNEVSADALEARGYQVLTYSPDAGVDLFVKQKRNLLVFFQGHPEYDPLSLWREHKRDVRRFLAAETDAYPQMPSGYFTQSESDRTESLPGSRARGTPRRDHAGFPVSVGPFGKRQRAKGVWNRNLSRMAPSDCANEDCEWSFHADSRGEARVAGLSGS
jgi:homoserine O-succinyltransferase/O-acetyltransferase